MVAWLDAHSFSPKSGAPLLVPGADGQAAFALASVADAADPLALAHLPSLLPPGRYQLCTQSPAALAPGPARPDEYV